MQSTSTTRLFHYIELTVPFSCTVYMNTDNSSARARAVWLSQHLNNNNDPPPPDHNDAPEDNGIAPLPLPPTNRTSRPHSLCARIAAWVSILFMAMAVVRANRGSVEKVVVAVVSTMATKTCRDFGDQPSYVGESPSSVSVDLPRSTRGDCYRILTPASFMKSFPLPHPVDKIAHEVVLDEIGWSEPEKLLSSLTNGRSLVCSRLSESVSIIQEFVKHLAYTCSGGTYTKFALNDAINVTRRRLKATVTEINVLATFYASMKGGYYELNTSSAEALEKGQLSHKDRTLIKNQPSDLEYLRIDFHKWWGLPFKEKLRKCEEARSGVTALDRESQRLEQIGLVFRELMRIVEDLAASVLQWDAEFDDEGSRQEWLQDWFRQTIYQNPQLSELWTKLLASVHEEEERLLVEITTEWCEW